MEKPLALTEEEGRDLIQIAEKNQLTLMVGNPAKQKGWMCACGIQLTFKGDEAVCKACSRKYKKVEPETIREV